MDTTINPNIKNTEMHATKILHYREINYASLNILFVSIPTPMTSFESKPSVLQRLSSIHIINTKLTENPNQLKASSAHFMFKVFLETGIKYEQYASAEQTIRNNLLQLCENNA